MLGQMSSNCGIFHNIDFLLPQHMTAAHKDWVCALDFLHSQDVLLSGCRGGMLKLWRVETGAPVCKLFSYVILLIYIS